MKSQEAVKYGRMSILRRICINIIPATHDAFFRKECSRDLSSWKLSGCCTLRLSFYYFYQFVTSFSSFSLSLSEGAIRFRSFEFQKTRLHDCRQKVHCQLRKTTCDRESRKCCNWAVHADVHVSRLPFIRT